MPVGKPVEEFFGIVIVFTILNLLALATAMNVTGGDLVAV